MQYFLVRMIFIPISTIIQNFVFGKSIYMNILKFGKASKYIFIKITLHSNNPIVTYGIHITCLCPLYIEM